MSFSLDHPDAWIGVPDHWPFPWLDGTEFSDPEHWIAALLDDLDHQENQEPPTPEVRERVREVLTMAAQRSAKAQTRVFVLFEGWDGPAFFAEALTQREEVLGTRTLEQLAGVDDPTQLGPAYVEQFQTDSGIAGVLCIRYLPFDEHGIVYGRLDYAFHEAGEVLTLSAGELDLVDFERLKVHVALLAASVVVLETSEE